MSSWRDISFSFFFDKLRRSYLCGLLKGGWSGVSTSVQALHINPWGQVFLKEDGMICAYGR